MRKRRVLAFVLAMQLALTSVMQVNAEKTNENTSGSETEIAQSVDLDKDNTGGGY